MFDREVALHRTARFRSARNAAVLALAIVTAACSGRDSKSSAPSATTAASAANDTASAPAVGTLKLTVRTPDGEPWAGSCSAAAIPIDGGLELQLSDLTQLGPEIEAALAPGRWRVRVDSEEHVHPCCVRAPTFSRYGATESECEVRVGETTALDVRLRAGGRLNVTVAVPESFKNAGIDELLALPECEQRERVVELADAKSGTRSAIVSVEKTATSPARRLSFLVPCCSRLTVDRVIAGMTSKSETFFAPGPLALRIEAPGFEPATAAITIESGRDTDVSIALVPISIAK